MPCGTDRSRDLEVLWGFLILKGMNKVVCGIYKITSPSNKVYIGQSLNIKRRFSEYKKLKCRGQKALYWSLNKYGFENHFFEILEECDLNNLNDRERYYQDLYDVLKSGLNCRLTKSNDNFGKLSEETKKKISLKATGRKVSEETKKNMSLSQTGRKHSEETKKKMSLKSKGNKVWLGRKHSEETKRRMSDKSIGRRHTEESKSKLRIKSKCKIVLDASNGIFYESIGDAAKSIGMKRSTLSAKLNGGNNNKTNLIIV